jgi:hypothetical protein
MAKATSRMRMRRQSRGHAHREARDCFYQLGTVDNATYICPKVFHRRFRGLRLKPGESVEVEIVIKTLPENKKK